MLSILCAKHLGVSAIVATDGDEAVVDAIKTNAFLNGLDGNHPSQKVVETAALKWGRRINASTFAEDYGMEVPDVLLGADVVSHSQHFAEPNHYAYYRILHRPTTRPSYPPWLQPCGNSST
jgi:ribosomal protein L11 methylase PrmA